VTLPDGENRARRWASGPPAMPPPKRLQCHCRKMLVVVTTPLALALYEFAYLCMKGLQPIINFWKAHFSKRWAALPCLLLRFGSLKFAAEFLKCCVVILCQPGLHLIAFILDIIFAVIPRQALACTIALFLKYLRPR